MPDKSVVEHDWPIEGQSMQRRRYCPVDFPPPLKLAWRSSESRSQLTGNEVTGADGTIVIATTTGRVEGLGYGGTKRWEWRPKRGAKAMAPSSSACLTAGKVYVPRGSCLQVFNATNGDFLWEVPNNEGRDVSDRLPRLDESDFGKGIIARASDGSVITASQRGIFRRIGPTPGTVSFACDPTALTNTCIGLGDHIIGLFRPLDGGEKTPYAINIHSGERTTVDRDIKFVSVLAGGMAYGSTGRALKAWSYPGWEPQWEVGFPKYDNCYQLASDGQHVYSLRDASISRHSLEDGHEEWSLTHDEVCYGKQAMLVTPSFVYTIYGSGHTQIQVLDKATGKEAWTSRDIRLPDWVRSLSAIGGRIFILEEKAIACFESE